MNDDKKNDNGNQSKTDTISSNTIIPDNTAPTIESDTTEQNLPKKLRKVRKDKGSHHSFKGKSKEFENISSPIKLDKEPKQLQKKTVKEKSNVTSAIILIALTGLAMLFVISVLIPKQKIEELKQKIMGRKEFYE